MIIQEQVAIVVKLFKPALVATFTLFKDDLVMS